MSVFLYQLLVLYLLPFIIHVFTHKSHSFALIPGFADLRTRSSLQNSISIDYKLVHRNKMNTDDKEHDIVSDHVGTELEQAWVCGLQKSWALFSPDRRSLSSMP